MPYDEKADAARQVAQAKARARAERKKLLIDLGGNWCPDCHVLDRYIHDSTNKPLLDADYILVHINIGRMNENLDIAER